MGIAYSGVTTQAFDRDFLMNYKEILILLVKVRYFEAYIEYLEVLLLAYKLSHS